MAAPQYATNYLKTILLFATDFDGVHTDGMVYVDQNGRESVRRYRRDSLGYDMLKKAEIAACIISKESNLVVVKCAQKLRIPCYQAVETGDGKLEILQRLASKQGLAPWHVLYMGDDVNDLPALKWAGLPVCPADAHKSVREYVMSVGGHVSSIKGGEGVIREAIEMVLVAKGLPLDF